MNKKAINWLAAAILLGLLSTIFASCRQEGTDYVLAAVEKDGKVGFIDTLGRWVIQPEFRNLTYFSEGLARMNDNGKWGFINTQGSFAIAAIYDNVLDFGEGRAAVRIDSLWGFIDAEGAQVVPFKYRSIRPYFEGKAAVTENGLWGWIDRSGKTLVEPKFGAALTFGEGLIAVRESRTDGRAGKWGFADESGAWSIEPKYEIIAGERFRKGLCLVADSSGFYFIDKQGKNVFGKTFPRANDFFSDLAAVVDTSFRNKLEWGLIDRQGKTVIQPNYLVCDPRGAAESGLIPVRRGRQFGFIDRRDSLRVPYRYDGVFPFSYGRSGVYTNGKFGFIDRKGELAIKPLYGQALPFHKTSANAFQEVDRQ